MIQECLTNILRHAHASPVKIDIEIDENILQIDVEDNGVGFDIHSKSDHLGLVYMRERALIAGGDIVMSSPPPWQAQPYDPVSAPLRKGAYTMTKVILVDDHQLVRAGLRALIDGLPEYSVVAEGSDGAEVQTLVDQHHPDVLISDLAMSNVSGFEVLELLSKGQPDLPVIVLSIHASKSIAIRALKAGAKAYLVNDSAGTELKFALQAICSGQQYLSPKVSGLVLAEFDEKTHSTTTKNTYSRPVKQRY